MSHPIIIPVRFGSNVSQDVVCDCIDGKCERHSMCDVSIGYLCGRKPPNYPVPAIPLNTVLYSDVYIGCMYIERLNYGEHDPVIVYLYDSWNDVSEYTD